MNKVLNQTKHNEGVVDHFDTFERNIFNLNKNFSPKNEAVKYIKKSALWYLYREINELKKASIFCPDRSSL